jgi:hypothetical protein
MRVPITDAFDKTDRLESLEVELTSKQIEWLRQKADERDLSLDHVLRSIITAQIRSQPDGLDASSSSTPSEDREPSAPSPASTNGTADRSDASGAADDDSPSIVDSLRSASERLQDLTENDDAETPDPHDTLQRLQARLGENGETENESDADTPGTVLLKNQNRSMFDLMEDEE